MTDSRILKQDSIVIASERSKKIPFGTPNTAKHLTEAHDTSAVFYAVYATIRNF
ncbi:MAG: hypothetical protein K2N70_02745 [Helicobacter sp.]|nr:hypothetical protein [Helicobacter sp.]